MLLESATFYHIMGVVYLVGGVGLETSLLFGGSCFMGKMAERFKAFVLKTNVLCTTGSNPVFPFLPEG